MQVTIDSGFISTLTMVGFCDSADGNQISGKKAAVLRNALAFYFLCRSLSYWSVADMKNCKKNWLLSVVAVINIIMLVWQPQREISVPAFHRQNF